MKFCKFLDEAYLILQVTDNLKTLTSVTKEEKQIRLISTHTETLTKRRLAEKLKRQRNNKYEHL